MLACQDTRKASARGSPRSQSAGTSGSSTSHSSPFRMVHCRRTQWDEGQKTTTSPELPQTLRDSTRGPTIEASGDATGAEAAAAVEVGAERGGGGTYSQMPMRAFLAQKDWRELLLKRDCGKLAKCKLSGNKYNRMLYSYHRLYQEYQYICACLLPPSKPSVGCCNELLIGLEPTDGGGGADKPEVGESTEVGLADEVGDAAAAATNNAFGSVLMADRNFRVRRCKKRRGVVCHRVLTRTAERDAVWLDVPIAVELLLPRLQEQIKAVMGACPHVSDPLEVLAELRTNRYDTERCVEYLRETLPLREVVRDILSVRSGRCAEARPTQPEADEGLRQRRPPQQLRELAPPPPPPQPMAAKPLQPASQQLPGLVAAAPPAEDCGGRPVLRGVRQLKDDLRVVRTSLRSVAAAMAAGLGKVRCHLSVQQERSRRLSRDGGVTQQVAVNRMQKCVDELRQKCKEEETRRRLVFNALQEQLGNIRVYCRCTRIEGDQAVETVGAETVRVRGQQQDEFFRFDRVFGTDAPQESLFEELKPLITSFLDGYNVCFITYGGEASGKTFTLLGTSKQRGLVYRALLAVLKEAANRETDWSLELDSTCLEIYNDACFDLLADRTAVSLYKDCGLSSAFAALRCVPIREEKDVTDLLRACAVRRRVAKTAMNPKSSRSHLVHLVRLQARSRLHGHTACSYLGMMDLAGAENIVKADTWRDPERAAEAGHINRSLAAFNRLFLTLRRTPPNAACYREARLTQMLKPFLVNHGKCCIIVTVRTDQQSTSTTMSTLRFGRDARQVALGKAQRQLLNVD